MNSIPTEYYGEITKRQRGWRRFFKPAAAALQSRQPEQAAGEAKATLPATPSNAAASQRNIFSGLRMRLVGTVFLAIVPPLLVLYIFKLGEWTGFFVGLVALAAAWYGGERFIMRQLRALLSAAEKLAQGDLTSRSGVTDGKSELGQLARTFDTMAESLQQRARENEQSEKLLLNRAQQQAVVAAIGQFAMLSQDFNSLLNQALQLAAETLDVQLAHVLELQPESGSLSPGPTSAGKRAAAGSALTSLKPGAGHKAHSSSAAARPWSSLTCVRRTALSPRICCLITPWSAGFVWSSPRDRCPTACSAFTPPNRARSPATRSSFSSRSPTPSAWPQNAAAPKWSCKNSPRSLN